MTTPSLTNPNPKREDEREAKATDVIGYLNVYRDDDGDLVTGSSDLCATAEEASGFAASDFADHVGVFALVPAASARTSPGDPVRAALEATLTKYRADCEQVHKTLTDEDVWLLEGYVQCAVAALSVSTPTGEGEADDLLWLRGQVLLLCEEAEDKALAELEKPDLNEHARGFYRGKHYEAKGIRNTIGAIVNSRIAERAALAHPQQGGERDTSDNDEAEIARVMAMSDDEVLTEGGDPEQVSLFVSAAFDRAKIIAENRRLRNALERARSVLGNMALEHETGWRSIFARWPVHHEPLRSDARHLLPVIDAAL